MTRRVAAVVCVLVTCASGIMGAKVKFLSTWKAPDANNLTYTGRKVVSLVMSDDEALRMSAEEAMARELIASGVEGVAAYRLVPKEEIRNPAQARGWFERSGVSGVIAIRLKDLSRETTPPSVMWASPTYGSLWSSYPYAWGSVYTFVPGRQDVRVVVETLAFDVPGDRMIWAATSQTMNPKDVQSFMKDLVKACGQEMRKQGLIQNSQP